VEFQISGPPFWFVLVLILLAGGIIPGRLISMDLFGLPWRQWVVTGSVNSGTGRDHENPNGKRQQVFLHILLFEFRLVEPEYL